MVWGRVLKVSIAFGGQTYLTIYSDQGVSMRVELLLKGDHYALKGVPGFLGDVVGYLEHEGTHINRAAWGSCLLIN